MDAATAPWWIWPLALFALTYVLGIVAVIAGIGGGVLFVPLVGSFFPFHLDFVRGAGLLLALAGTLAAAPLLLRARLANLRLVLPLALADRSPRCSARWGTGASHRSGADRARRHGDRRSPSCCGAPIPRASSPRSRTRSARSCA